MKNLIELCVPPKFIELSKKFEFTAEYLALMLISDFCAQDPNELLISSDFPIEYPIAAHQDEPVGG